MEFKEGTPLYASEVVHEGGEDILYFNFLGASFVPSLVDDSRVMELIISSLTENPNVSRIVLVQQKNYNYDFKEASYLLEIAQLYNYLIKQENILSPSKLGYNDSSVVSKRYNDLYSFVSNLKSDPVMAYKDLSYLIVEARIALDKSPNRNDYLGYVYLLEKIVSLLEKTKLISDLSDYLDDYRRGDREIYYKIFSVDVIPNYTFTRLVKHLPSDIDIVDQYEISHGDYDKSLVTIFGKEDEAKLRYHVVPPEHTLSEEHNSLLNLARGVLIEHQPRAEEFTDTERTRQVFFNISRDLIRDLAQSKNVNLSYSELNTLATILVRYTVGFGLIEVLLQDSNLQDIMLNSPIPQTPIFVKHQEYGECSVNILPSQEDVDSWAAKFRMISGRPLDEANPILDTQLEIGGMSARIAIIQQPLSPDGLAYAIRRHREEPWTLPLFVKNGMLTGFAAGLMSFLIDGSRTLLVAGTRSSGKTSLLGSMMLEIIPKYRIIVLEDSVCGDSKIIVKENGKFVKTSIGELIDEKVKKYGFRDIDGREKELNVEDVEVFSVDKDGKVILAKASKFIRHRTTKPIYEVKTTSGKKIKVTEDHSLFTLDEKNILKQIKPNQLSEGSYIAIPYKLPFDNSIERINLLDYLDKLDKKIFVLGEGIEEFISKDRKELFSVAYSLNYKKSAVQNWTVKKIIPLDIFKIFEKKIDKNDLKIKSYGASKKISVDFYLDEDLMSFVGLWLADGCYDKDSIIISVQEEENREVVRRVAERFGIDVKMHSDGFSLILNSSLLKEIMQKVLELNGNSYTKNIPSWCYNLSDEKIGALLKGFFSGDGCASDKEVVFSSCSKELVDDITTLLLRFNIVLRCSDIKIRDKTYGCRIGNTEMLNSFKENIGFLVDSKNENLEKLCSRISTHDTSDIIPISLEIKEELNEILGNKFNRHDYMTRKNNIGRTKLNSLLKEIPVGVYTNPIDPLRNVVSSDIFWDKVKSVELVNSEEYVYDISVPECENFICENIIAHNTLELPVEAMRKLKYDILRMKVRSSLLKTTTEVSADEGIRTSLRLGDSSLIVGEVRSVEAKALYEAMRVGALANVVAGTIHGASPYAIFDRVVNDLGVPATSFKATDIIAVANPIKSPDGLHSWKRLVQVAEVRKHWKEDPSQEGGFVDLLRFDIEKDELVPSDALMNGDSEVIKSIAGNVKGWAGNWDAIYDNIILRGKIKDEIVKISKQLNRSDILEAKFNVLSNNAFHKISSDVREEIGLPMSDRVFPEWQKWLNEKVKGKSF